MLKTTEREIKKSYFEKIDFLDKDYYTERRDATPIEKKSLALGYLHELDRIDRWLSSHYRPFELVPGHN
jgi:hypothetical protein